MDKRSFLKGAAALALSGVICKILGAVYRVPLANTIGSEGMGNYQMAYPVYSLLIVISSAGVPIAVSKLVAEECAKGNYRGANEVFKVSMTALLAVGFVSFVILYAAARPIAMMIGLESAAFSLRMLSFSLIFVAAVSAYRGYLQGRQLMGATSVSQISEQIVRLTLGLYIARMWMPKGPEYGSGGALLGVTISELAGLLVIMGYYYAKRKDFAFKWTADKARIKKILRSLWRLAFPVTVGACATAMVGAIDSAVVLRVLTRAGYSTQNASSLYGLLSGFVQPIVNMPAVIFSALSIAIVPALSAEIAKKRKMSASHHAELAYKTAIMLALPCSAGLFVLARPILMVMFSSLSGEELAISASLMKILAPAVFFMAIAQITTGILQGMGRTVYPVATMLLGSTVKLFLGMNLIGIGRINIMGAAIGTLICFIITSVINTLLVMRYADVRIHFKTMILPYFLSAAGMCAGVFAVERMIPNDIGTWLAVLAGVIIYAILLFVTKGIDKAYLGALKTQLSKKRGMT
ncbi:MAG: polysaccharide biosynthesis protein [Christensenellaceae bacterium]|nr:polysaccharide biosynthesis protein [Christensenellaceae bacterium]